MNEELKKDIQSWIKILKYLQQGNMEPEKHLHPDENGEMQPFDYAEIDMGLGEVIHQMEQVLKEEPKKSARELWQEFGDVPINDNDEIEQDFYHFKKGTSRYDVWHWFEEIDPTFSVGEMLNGSKN